jgi:hypothetical protein
MRTILKILKINPSIRPSIHPSINHYISNQLTYSVVFNSNTYICAHILPCYGLMHSYVSVYICLFFSFSTTTITKFTSLTSNFLVFRFHSNLTFHVGCTLLCLFSRFTSNVIYIYIYIYFSLSP